MSNVHCPLSMEIMFYDRDRARERRSLARFGCATNEKGVAFLVERQKRTRTIGMNRQDMVKGFFLFKC